MYICSCSPTRTSETCTPIRILVRQVFVHHVCSPCGQRSIEPPTHINILHHEIMKEHLCMWNVSNLSVCEIVDSWGRSRGMMVFSCMHLVLLQNTSSHIRFLASYVDSNSWIVNRHLSCPLGKHDINDILPIFHLFTTIKQYQCPWYHCYKEIRTHNTT